MFGSVCIQQAMSSFHESLLAPSPHLEDLRKHFSQLANKLQTTIEGLNAEVQHHRNEAEQALIQLVSARVNFISTQEQLNDQKNEVRDLNRIVFELEEKLWVANNCKASNEESFKTVLSAETQELARTVNFLSLENSSQKQTLQSLAKEFHLLKATHVNQINQLKQQIFCLQRICEQSELCRSNDGKILTESATQKNSVVKFFSSKREINVLSSPTNAEQLFLKTANSPLESAKSILNSARKDENKENVRLNTHFQPTSTYSISRFESEIDICQSFKKFENPSGDWHQVGLQIDIDNESDCESSVAHSSLDVIGTPKHKSVVKNVMHYQRQFDMSIWKSAEKGCILAGMALREQSMACSPSISPQPRNQPQHQSAKAVRQIDPYYSFFLLTTQCIKINSPKFGQIADIDVNELWDQFLKEGIPFHEWHIHIESALNQKSKQIYKKLLQKDKKSQQVYSKSKLSNQKSQLINQKSQLSNKKHQIVKQLRNSF